MPNKYVITQELPGIALDAQTGVKKKTKARGQKQGGPNSKSLGKITAGFKTGRQEAQASDFAASVSGP